MLPIKYFTEILWLWYICPIFSILKIVLNMALDKKYESLCCSVCLWCIEVFHWNCEHFLKLSCLIIFFLTVAFVLLFVPAFGHVAVNKLYWMLKFWNFIRFLKILFLTTFFGLIAFTYRYKHTANIQNRVPESGHGTIKYFIEV